MQISFVFRWSWFTLLYLLFVILWGAFVRATGSGAGCGDHWPLCNGVVIPRTATIQTLIELTHRVTSGLSLIFVFMLFVFARRVSIKGHPLRRAAAWTLGFIIVEALIGAALVLFELVGMNASLKRMYSMSAHLLNTFALLTALCLCIWRSSETYKGSTLRMSWIFRHPVTWISGLLLILTGMTGAIAALGDTLYAGMGPFPIQAYLDGEVPLLLRLRLLHPVTAVLAVVVLIYHQTKMWKLYEFNAFARVAWSVSVLALIQIVLGLVNVQLKAPVWMQLVHLGFAVALWVAYSFECFLVIDKGSKYQEKG